MGDTQRDGIFLFNWEVLDPICFEFPDKALVQSDVSLRVRGILGVGDSCQEVGFCNRPPCLRNQLLPKSAQSEIGVLGVTDLVPVDLEDIDARDG